MGGKTEQRAVKISVITVLNAANRSSRLSNLRGGSNGKVLAPQGITVADFPTGNELDAANGVVNEDAAIEISRKLVVDSLKVSSIASWCHVVRRSCSKDVFSPAAELYAVMQASATAGTPSTSVQQVHYSLRVYCQHCKNVPLHCRLATKL